MKNKVTYLSAQKHMRILVTSLISILLLVTSCSKPNQLTPVTVAQFETFVKETNYITDAEKFGWSIVQKTVFTYDIIEGATWRSPKGISDTPQKFLPVTQVSHNDAIAYCKWANVTLPTYDQYWKFAKNDTRTIISDSDRIRPATEVNVVGNTWDITLSKNSIGEIRLAGGSYLCNTHTCNGTKPERVLYVSADTGNSHISFSVY